MNAIDHKSRNAHRGRFKRLFIYLFSTKLLLLSRYKATLDDIARFSLDENCGNHGFVNSELAFSLKSLISELRRDDFIVKIVL